MSKETDKEPSLAEIVKAEYEKGNIVIATMDGLEVTKLEDFLKQPIEGMLYDLNRGEEVILTFINDPKWVNDYAMTKVLRELWMRTRLSGETKEQEQKKKFEEMTYDELMQEFKKLSLSQKCEVYLKMQELSKGK